MRKNLFILSCFILILSCNSKLSAQDISTGMHCGFDFTSYLVVDAHSIESHENIKNLKISIVDENGVEVINTNNALSWNHNNQPLFFYQNYQIDTSSKKAETTNETQKWFFPYAKDNYILSVTNNFPADNYWIKIEDISGIYKTEIIQLYNFNMYILCSIQVKQAASFGRKPNKPIEVILIKN